MKFDWIKANSSSFSVKKMCEILEISRSRFYEFCKNPISAIRKRDEPILAEIQRIHKEHEGRYGSPRIASEIRDSLFQAGVNKVARIMRENGIFGRICRKYKVVTTDSNHDHPIAENILNRNFNAEKPNEKWVSDITYVLVGNTWAYLCTIMDLWNREIIGWRLSIDLSAKFVVSTFESAMQRRGNPTNVLFHSDRGVQYACNEFRKILSDRKCIQSMSRKGNCWDNAVMESFFHTLKLEAVPKEGFSDFEEAKSKLFDYLERYYNRCRRHSAIDYQKPSLMYEKLVA